MGQSAQGPGRPPELGSLEPGFFAGRRTEAVHKLWDGGGTQDVYWWGDDGRGPERGKENRGNAQPRDRPADCAEYALRSMKSLHSAASCEPGPKHGEHGAPAAHAPAASAGYGGAASSGYGGAASSGYGGAASGSTPKYGEYGAPAAHAPARRAVTPPRAPALQAPNYSFVADPPEPPTRAAEPPAWQQWAASVLAPVTSSGPRAPRKRAVLVAEQYAGQPHALPGAAQDGRLWRQAFAKLGVEPEDMRVLGEGEAATRDRIWQALQWLIEGASRGDTLVFVFCGLATEAATEDGAWTGCLLPSDFGTSPGSWIPTTWLQHTVARVPAGVDMVVLLDASVDPLDLGTSKVQAHARRAAQPPCAPPHVRARFVPMDTPQRLCRLPSPYVACNCYCYTATRPGEAALELMTDSRCRGVFTYVFCKALRDALRTKASVSYLELAEDASAGLLRFAANRGFEACGVVGKTQRFAMTRSPTACLAAPFANFAGTFHKPLDSHGTNPTSSGSTRASSGW